MAGGANWVLIRLLNTSNLNTKVRRKAIQRGLTDQMIPVVDEE